MGFVPKKKDDETKAYPPLTDPEFRKAGLSPITIEERRKWEVLFARFHRPHDEVVKETVVQVTQNVTQIIGPPAPDCYWTKVGDDVWYMPGDVYCSYELYVTNVSNTVRDPVMKFAVGDPSVVQFTYGVDDSDNNDLKWSNTSTLPDTTTGTGIGWGPNLLIVNGHTNNLPASFNIKNHLRSDLSYVSKVTVPQAQDGVCADGTHYYVTLRDAHQVKKFLMADNSLVWTIGTTAGTGDDQFDTPHGICTDGTYLYIVDYGNYRIKKHLCSTGAYDSKLGSFGTGVTQFGPMWGICTDGTYLYITQTAVTILLRKHRCSDLTWVAWTADDGHLLNTTLTFLCTDGMFIYLVDTNQYYSGIAILKYTKHLVYVSGYGTLGSGDTQFSSPYGICTDGTYLYVMDAGNARIKQHLVSDYSFVAKYGTSGDAETNFYAPRGVCLGWTGNDREGKLLVLHQDGSSFDAFLPISAYQSVRFYEDVTNPTEYVSLRGPASIADTVEWTLPGEDSVGTQALTSNGAGAMGWTTYLTTVTAHNLLSATHGDVVAAAVYAGSFIYCNATPKWDRFLPNSTATKKFLSETSSVPSWVTLSAADAGADPAGTGNTEATDHVAAHASVITGVHGLAITAGQTLTLTTSLTNNTGAGTLTWPAAGATLTIPTGGGTLGTAAFTAATAYEPALGNPGTTGWVLSSTDAGVRSWVAMSAGALDDLTDVDAAAPSDHDIIQYHTGVGWVHGALPAGANHDILSATHGDTTVSAPNQNDVLTYDTGKWVAAAPTGGGDFLVCQVFS